MEPQNYDFKKRMQIVLENESNRTIMQSWGRGPITNIKKIAAGDIAISREEVYHERSC